MDAQRKAREKRDEANRFAEESANNLRTQTAMQAEVQRLLAETQRQAEEMRTVTAAEAKRRKQAADRAEKRARRLQG